MNIQLIRKKLLPIQKIGGLYMGREFEPTYAAIQGKKVGVGKTFSEAIDNCINYTPKI